MQEWPDALHLLVLRHLGGPDLLLGYLKPYSELCQACKAASMMPVLWREINMNGPGTKSLEGEGMLGLLRRYGVGAVERLSFRESQVLDNGMLNGVVALLAAPLPHLRCLDLGNCHQITAAGVTDAITVNHLSLEELSLENRTDMHDDHLLAIRASCPLLSRLDVRYCEWLTDPGVLLTGTWASLQLDGCYRLDVAGLLAQSPAGWANLEELSLDGEDLMDTDFVLLARLCQNLRSLAISFARELLPGSLEQLAKLPALDSLVLKKATQPSDVDWAVFFEQQAKSRYGTATPAEGCWKILNLAECELLADAAAHAIACARQPVLADVDLSWCWHLSDEGLGALLSVSPSLKRLKVAGMKSLTSLGVIHCCRTPRLEELDCTSCNSVTDGVLEFLHRLFTAPPGTAAEALPSEGLSPQVANVADALWKQRPPGSARLKVKNYYNEYLEDWTSLRPDGALEVMTEAETLLEVLAHGKSW